MYAARRPSLKSIESDTEGAATFNLPSSNLASLVDDQDLSAHGKVSVLLSMNIASEAFVDVLELFAVIGNFESHDDRLTCVDANTRDFRRLHERAVARKSERQVEKHRRHDKAEATSQDVSTFVGSGHLLG
jgi:hypothetical protein